jgi:hypothetical protein
MAVGEEGHVASDGMGAGDDAMGSFTHLLYGLAVRDAVFPEIPLGTVLANFGGGEAFVGAVIPFEEIGGDFGAIGISGQAAGFAGALEGACENQGKRASIEAIADGDGLTFAVRGERDVGESRVGAGEAPGGFAVAD